MHNDHKSSETYKIKPDLEKPYPKSDGKIKLLKGDSLTVAQLVHLRQSKNTMPVRILLLNFANNYSFCDNKYLGRTQEENIFQRTDLYITKNFYPISEPESDPTYLLSKNITVLRDNDGKSSGSFNIDIISSAAIRNPRSDMIVSDTFDYDKFDYCLQSDKQIMMEKIKAIVWEARNYDVLITGAWGTGVFGNPMYGLINLWNEALKKDIIPLTIFAVPDGDTLRLFKRFLHTK